MKVLVTGGAGFIGSHIVDSLASAGHAVLCIDSLDSEVYHRVPPYLRDDVDYAFVDLRHWTPDERYHDVEAVIHLAALGGVARAARQPANVLSANVGGTARLLEAARTWPHLQRVMLASSFSVYGSNYSYAVPGTDRQISAHRSRDDLESGIYEVLDPVTRRPGEILPITEQAIPAPLETYGASKYMQELCFRGFDHCPVTVFRFSSVYGTRLRLDDGEATIIARLAAWIRDDVSPTLFEDGRQIRDWVFVGDIVAAMNAVLARPGSAPAYVNACSGQPTTLLEACEVLRQIFGTSVAAQVVGGYRPGDMRHCLGDATTFTHLLGRDPLTFAQGAPLAFAEASLVEAG